MSHTFVAPHVSFPMSSASFTSSVIRKLSKMVPDLTWAQNWPSAWHRCDNSAVQAHFLPAKGRDQLHRCCQTCRWWNRGCIRDCQSQDGPRFLCSWDCPFAWVSSLPATERVFKSYAQAPESLILGVIWNIVNSRMWSGTTQLPCILGWGSLEAPTLHPCLRPSRLAFWHQGQGCFQACPSPEELTYFQHQKLILAFLGS